MRNSAKILIGLGVLALVMGLAGCNKGAGAKGPDSNSDWTLHAYTVPDGSANRLRTTLNRVFSKNHIARVSVVNDGQILVLASKSIQDSISAAIKQIAGEGPETAKSFGPLRLNAWIVDVYPGQGAMDPSLKAVQPALKAFVHNFGPSHFVLAHYFAAVSGTNGYNTRIEPSSAYGFNYSLKKSGSGLRLSFDYKQHWGTPGMSRLQGRVPVQPGQTLVLGLVSERTNDQAGKTSAAEQSAGAVHRVLVVRITPVKQG